jgi:hypothetical protein
MVLKEEFLLVPFPPARATCPGVALHALWRGAGVVARIPMCATTHEDGVIHALFWR